MSLLTIIDNAIENLSLKSKTEIFIFLDNKCPKQLNLIDNELNLIVTQLDEMKNVDGKKSRIVQIQLIQKIIDVILKIDSSQEFSKKEYQEQLVNEQQKNRELEESIVVKNTELGKVNKKMNTLMQNHAAFFEEIKNERRKNYELVECIDVKTRELEKMNTLLQKNAEIDKINTICRNHDMEKLRMSNETLKQENDNLLKNYHLLESSLKEILGDSPKLIQQAVTIVKSNETQTGNYYNDKIESLVTENEILKRQNESLSKNFMQLQTTLKERITENENLTKNITVELQKNKLLNSAIGLKNEKIAALEKQSNPFNFIGKPNAGFPKF